MKKAIFAALLILVSFCGFSQAPKNSNILMGTEGVSVINANSDSENNTIIFGYYTGTLQPKNLPELSSRNGSRDYFLAKFDAASELLWVKSLGSDGLEYILGGLAIGADNSIYITGGFSLDFYYTDVDFLTSTGRNDIFIAKYDSDGNNTYCINAGSGSSGTTHQRPTALNLDAQGNILLGGFYSGDIIIDDTTLTTVGDKDYFLAKLDPADASLIWAKAFKSVDNTTLTGFLYSFSATTDNYYLSGVYADSVLLENDTIVSSTLDYYDTHIIKTDTDGNIIWRRDIMGGLHDYTYTSILDPDDNIYVTGYYNSTTLTFDSTDTHTKVINEYNGTYDFFVAKYTSDGILDWAKVTGGIGEDRLVHSSFYDNKLWVTGYFVDEIDWGAQTLTTAGGASDMDMFYGSISPEGIYTGATTFSGRSNSTEQGRAIFNDANTLYIVFTTDSDLMSVGDSTYLNAPEMQYLVVASVGCLPISVSIDNKTDVSQCYGDSTGNITLVATGGFDGSWSYSIGDDYPYQASPYFPNLPAGTYSPSALDWKNCFGTGANVTLTQPTQVVVDSYTIMDTICLGTSDGSIVVSASGGTGYGYTISSDSGQNYTPTIDNLNAGIYHFFVRDAFLCETKIVTDTIVEYEIAINDYSITDTICTGASDGEIVIDASNGKAPYTISSDGGSSYSATIDNLPAGAYDIYVSDANNCAKAVAKDTIFDYQMVLGTPLVTVNGVDIDYICYDSTASVSMDVSGNKGDYMFSIDTGKTFIATIPELTPGTYAIQVKDNFGCVETSSDVTINQYDLITITDITPSDIVFNTHGDLKEAGTIVVTATGGTSPLTYVLIPSDIIQSSSTFTFENASDIGTYSVQVSDINNCTPVVSDEVELDTTILTNLEDIQVSSGKLYPNPTTGIFILELETEKPELKLEIFSIDGKTVINRSIYSASGYVYETIDISDMNRGYYLIRLDGKIIQNKIVLK